eukprot:TRINITY_DN41_c0_g1_i1.p1 TRINITY_DN41_c0_g1~~TRINITY_DN41_c0_g1_i1.p1  ORF type:complete len:187 (+),score=20.00 TRINITY_DN41_c0_g1_i1:249-809(+)
MASRNVYAAATVALVATVVMALAACCTASDDIFIHFGEADKVSVFSQSPRNKLPIGFVFGDGQVFDYQVTDSADSDGQEVGRYQGLFYRSSGPETSFTVDKEEITILFTNNAGKYTGTSFSFSGVWISGGVHEFPILGGTGYLTGLQGTITLVTVTSGSVYKVQLNELGAPHFQSFLANSAFRHLA